MQNENESDTVYVRSLILIGLQERQLNFERTSVQTRGFPLQNRNFLFDAIIIPFHGETALLGVTPI